MYCGKKKKYHNTFFISRTVKFSTFPDILVLNPRRFAFVDWVPQKLSKYSQEKKLGLLLNRLCFFLDITIKFPEGPIQLDKYKSQGQQPGEELLPEDDHNASDNASSSEPSFNQNDIDQLLAMGFSENRCKRALLNTGHNGAEVAMSWMFEHMEDPGK